MTDDRSRPGRVVELFAGVGGFRIGLEREPVGFDPETGWSWQVPEDPDWQVVWANQWEPSTKSQPAFDCYRTRFEGAGVHVNEDIAQVLNEAGVPRFDGVTRVPPDQLRDTPTAPPHDFDLLVGGYPCQDYSVAKPLRSSRGLGGDKGILWWEIARMLQQYRPPHVLLENVDRLLKSPAKQRGRDFAVMLASFAQLGYLVEWRVVNAADYGFPQRRRRVFIYATREPAILRSLGVDGEASATEPATWRELLDRRGAAWLAQDGVLAEGLPCSVAPDATVEPLALGDEAGELDPYAISQGWAAAARSPWQAAGVMVGGVAWTVDVEPVYDGPCHVLGDVLLPLERVVHDHPSFLIPTSQLDFSDEPDRSTWNYHKGAKRERRTKRSGGSTFTYHYTEGAIAFPEPLDRASRTILTGEGGRSPSRFKLVVEQPVPGPLIDGDVPDALRDAAFVGAQDATVVYRRLTPVELERLDGFPDGWTAQTAPGRPMADGRRAFCVGNALVIGIVHRIGAAIANRRQHGGLRVIEGQRSA